MVWDLMGEDSVDVCVGLVVAADVPYLVNSRPHY